jgi:release factor glutamine methyltransferase
MSVRINNVTAGLLSAFAVCRVSYTRRVTVLEAIQRSAEFLTRKGVDSPRLQAELLLAHVLKLPRMKLYLNFERPLVADEVDALRAAVQRRGQREPLQHIVGSTSFCGFELAVNRHVLVPRPETEMLAELGWRFLSTFNCHPSTALDFGTGSGCLAVALAAKCPQVQVTALDVSADALDVARQNVTSHGLQERVRLVEGDGFTALPIGARFNLIISNPPYIPTAEIETLDPEVRDFDPRTALDGGGDGLDFVRRLATESGVFLAPAGRLMVELGDGQDGAAREIFAGQNWIVEAVQEDYSRRSRFLIARRA